MSDSKRSVAKASTTGKPRSKKKLVIVPEAQRITAFFKPKVQPSPLQFDKDDIKNDTNITSTSQNNDALQEAAAPKTSTKKSRSALSDTESDIDHNEKPKKKVVKKTTTRKSAPNPYAAFEKKRESVRKLLDEVIPTLPRSEQLKRVLSEVFGLESFREGQLDIINATLDSHDCVVIMPTGGGKSLTYQLPALITSGVTLVVSPLLALIQNQVDYLQSIGVEAQTVNSTIPITLRRKIIADLESIEPTTRILFVTPELLATEHFQNILINMERKGRLKRLVVDEAHCISEWGFGFRSDYTKLGWFKFYFPHLPVIALTATANDNVKKDMAAQLRVSKDYKLFTTTFSRPNLYYEVKHIGGDFEKMASFKEFIDSVLENRKKRLKGRVLKAVIPTDEEKSGDSSETPVKPEVTSQNSTSDDTQRKSERVEGVCGIVYCHRRSDCDEVATFITGLGLHASSYHAGIPNKKREEILRQWCDTSPTTIINPIDIVVATISFGMGIDKRDVRFVCHWNIPKTMEGYYQESGRAGRDGKVSRCLLFYSRSDRQFMEMLLQTEVSRALDSARGRDDSSYRKAKELQFEREKSSFNSLVTYCESTTKCRHAIITDYFTGSKLSNIQGHGTGKTQTCANVRCDVCQGIARSNNTSKEQSTTISGKGKIVESYQRASTTFVKASQTSVGQIRIKSKGLGVGRAMRTGGTTKTNGFVTASQINASRTTIMYGEGMQDPSEEGNLMSGDYGVGGGVLTGSGVRHTRKATQISTTMDSLRSNRRMDTTVDSDAVGGDDGMFERRLEQMRARAAARRQ